MEFHDLCTDTRKILRNKKYGYSTEKAYIRWINRFLLYHDCRRPDALGEREIHDFLTHLAVGECMSASSRNLALNSIVFLYRHVLRKDPGDLRPYRRNQNRMTLPVVLTQDEVRLLLSNLHGICRLLASLLYGSGLRHVECLRLRVRDIDFRSRRIAVRDVKGRSDRFTILPMKLIGLLEHQLKKAERLHQEDLSNGYGSVGLPSAHREKSPDAHREWKWQYVFPSARKSIDPRSGIRRRHHLHPSMLPRHIRQAAVESRIAKSVSTHTLRHSFAAHLLENGYGIRTVQELLGHKDIRKTMFYISVANQGVMRVRSPLDSLI